MKTALTELPLSKASLRFSSIFSREYCVLWLLRNPVSTLGRKGSMYSLI